MRFEKPEYLALLIAAIIALLTGAVLGAVSSFQPLSVDVTTLLIISLIIGLLSYILVRYLVVYFIYDKVKIIYKNIHELKRGTAQRSITQSSDLAIVSKDVAEWAEERKAEITELKERETFRREFIGNISHELKTPIFNIQGYLLTLLDGALDDPEINRKYLKRANKSVDRMINIIDDLEIISNLEAKRVHLQLSNFDLVALVKEVFEFLEETAKKNDVGLRLKKEYDRPIKVKADRLKIEQVLVNLISNAIKYGKPDGVVDIRFYDMHDKVLLEVTDDGIGIPEEDVPRIFERFYRVDKSRSREAGGTGLGLAIVKHIMEAHDEVIQARSKEEEGSTFSLTLKKAK